MYLLKCLLELVLPKFKRDELIGTWLTDKDGGGIHMIAGQALGLRKDGKGTYDYWSNTDLPYDRAEPIEWRRVNKNTICIRLADKGDDWDFVDYSISSTIGPYKIRMRKLVSPSYKHPHFDEGFWEVCQALYM